METETIKKIDAILERVKEPESGLSIAQPGLIKRVRYSEALLSFTKNASAIHLPSKGRGHSGIFREPSNQ